MAIDLHREFPQDPAMLYLNHAAVAPWPARSRDAVIRFAEENARSGARHYPQWLATEQRLREQLKTLIGAASADDIALLKNTSEGLSVVASGLGWQPGDRILISDQEFPSNRIPWQALATQGVEVSAVSLDADDPEGALIAAMDERVRLLAISAVQFGSGLRLDMQRLGEACRARGILFCVDAIQAIGAIPVDVQQWQADFVVADGHKWMLGPEGLALFWCRPALRSKLTLHQFGWHMVEQAGDYDRQDWQPASSARRFECGSPNILCAHALSASLSLLLEVGMDQVSQRLADRVSRLQLGLQQRDMQLISPPSPDRRAGIVTFRSTREDTPALFRRLTDAGVVCAPRGGGVRLSPHFYTSDSVIDRLLAVL
ncbi:aminotransferase class V-fold PLP-dependent enzyme [Alcanivorax sp. 1008]|uniref:aminotransferase class V-fold PLP-dependent enzyme n=1 Tax=Alcanivorax sp. 1008 TaxID=2816853 RepID=UPI001DEFD590|nr:aminotransferase class V-fold PLP-dependent enzyme [Alcanivorax sp. 1008]MCC1497716.1 aminotransferase class V-fold PLP-dependent enzyme [Alcanivorax sp. 1008]